MVKETMVVLKTVGLTNNCPECFNQDLSLTFNQKHTFGNFFHKVTNEVSNKLNCNTCSCTIYPISWTDDIERMFLYYQKTIVPEPKSSKPTLLFYSLLLVLACLLIGVFYLLFNGTIQF